MAGVAPVLQEAGPGDDNEGAQLRLACVVQHAGQYQMVVEARDPRTQALTRVPARGSPATVTAPPPVPPPTLFRGLAAPSCSRFAIDAAADGCDVVASE